MTQTIGINLAPVTHSGDVHVHYDLWDAFRHKSAAELEADLAVLRPSLAATRRAFLTHLTVWPFVVAVLMFAAVILAGDVLKEWLATMPLALRIGLTGVQVVTLMATALWMTRERRPLYDGLLLLKDMEKRIESLLAIREAEAAAGMVQKRKGDG